MSKTFTCNCEHVKHDTPSESVHPMFTVIHEQDVWNSAYVGAVCADCAAFCVPEYILGKL
jgi:hypothetical protein